ncbi:indole-diterpene biosynthesis protein PaxU [Ceratobasidium sp. AG-Ba]|nr:indole-diterpene biosynthesis protein PaxU [Ceratobasidium sp. AG-Ba]
MSSIPPSTGTPKAALQRTFTRIDTSDVFVSYPSKDPAEQTKDAGKPPSVILFCGWMDAQLVHLYKYTEHYHKLYPSATQILVRSHQKYFWANETTRRASVVPVLKLLRDSGINPGDQPESSGLLYSGGAIVLTSIARQLAETSNLSPALPAQALIFDSLPGTIDLQVTIRAFTAPIRSAPIRAVASVIFGAVYIVGKIWKSTIGVLFRRGPDVFEQMHAGLHDPKLLSQNVPRTYLYSDVDELVQMESVEAHANEAKGLLQASGVDPALVRLVKFEGSKHVSHVRQDPQRYWAAVVDTWNASFRS